VAKEKPARKIAAENRRARYNFAISENLDAGIMLKGSEIKSLRLGKASIQDAYAGFNRGEEGLWLINAHIPEYTQANRENHEPRRPRKLLMRKRELARLQSDITRGGMTLVPLLIYFNDKGLAKVELGLAKGKKLHDKRETEKQRDWQREKGRLMRDKG
jgi:SsrA-binding protein